MHSVWTSDHFVVPRVIKTRFPGTEDGEYPPDWRVGYLSARKECPRLSRGHHPPGRTLGTSASVLPLRNPVQLAKEIATIDVLPGGRVVFGVGYG